MSANDGDQSPLLHVEQIHSCKHCERITLRKREDQGWNFMSRLPHTKSEARAAAHEGCPLFELFVEAFGQATTLRSLSTVIRSMLVPPTQSSVAIPSPLIKWWFDEDKSAVQIYLSRIAYIFGHFRRRHLYLTFSGPTMMVHYLMWRNESVGLHATASRGNMAEEFVRDSPINPYVSSDGSFALARRWLTKCHSSHPSCRMEPSSFAPSRLIRIDLNDPQTPLRLIDATAGEGLRWCALSYVWGGDQPIKTTKASLASLQKAIPLEQLPQTLQGAVLVSRELAVENLWVDCLCIIQDDLDDLQRELGAMPQIYQRSFVTISASSGKSVREGFLQDRGYFYKSTQPMKLQYQASTGVTGALIFFETHASSPEDPIDSRAWTYQERRLSPRFLEYTTTQLKWTCRTLRTFDGDHAPFMFADDEGVATPTEIPCLEGRPLPQWRRVVCGYTSRNLTMPNDKLIAISAIAKMYRQSTGHTYLAGLWKECLPQELCWRLSEGSSLSSRPREYRAPSWSWAAVDGEIHSWLYGFGLDAYVVQIDATEILEVTVTQMPPNTTYGTITAGRIAVKGRIATVEWYYNRRELNVEDHQMDAFPDAKEEGLSSAADAHMTTTALFVLKAQPTWIDTPDVRRCGLILREDSSGTYKRVGFFQCRERGHKNCTHNFDRLETREILII